ncbi:MAG: hypothetical protein RR420_05570 [Anaerovoracaceae bacterium]
MKYLEITGETVKSAVGQQVKKIFPDIPWYKDSVTLPKYPNFFVNQLQVIATPDRLNRWLLTYLFSIEYRIANDLTTITNINTQLDKIAMELFYGMENLEEIKVRTKNQRAEKSEGILVFIFDVNVWVRKEQVRILQNELDLKIISEYRE